MLGRVLSAGLAGGDEALAYPVGRKGGRKGRREGGRKSLAFFLKRLSLKADW